jgi:branched-chain amino acid transport system permease protein
LSAASIVAVVLVAIGLPFLVGQFWAYQLGLYALFAVAALGVGVCWGQAGILPLGQALFFGLAAYLSGFAFIALADRQVIAVLALPFVGLVSGLLAYAVGFVVFRRSGESGAYFSMITLALGLLAFQLAASWNSVTGGFNGLKGIPGLPGLDDIDDVYCVSAATLLAMLAFAGWLYAAPIGVLWRALAQNERRLQLFGFDTCQLKAVAFGVSGLIAGIGGAVYAPQQGIVTPQVVGFGLSADLVVWAAVGGRASLLGPVVGTLLVGALTAQLRDRLPFWEVLLALFFIAIVLIFPSGIAGLPEPLLRRFTRRKSDKAAIIAPGDPVVRPPVKLALQGVSAQVGEVTILDKLCVEFDQAGIFCVIGPNGAGKTSMFNVVSGELAAASGKISLGGSTISGLAPNRISSLGVARKLQIPSVFRNLSIADNLAIALWSGRARKIALLDPRLRRWTSPILKELQLRYPFLASGTRKAAELSHGEQQILELAMALLIEPRVLLLDEPCAGLSPEETTAVIEIVRWAAQRLGGAIIIIEHDMSLVKELAQVVYVLHNGALLANGSVAAIQADPAVRAVYVGGVK